ncbi:ABC transporter substrate-binding protein [Corynebacterium aquatimens]|uniref:Thiamine pyrimidine synthase n=1 Tax=Corynebacterium aquatimens TaxID=1190508 RepID=A0A931E3Y2_9CORY|nr:ABC transporter substrate-binding protein [Corynebacterium aquatimens]MBG6122043.1 ABC-type nitrate/sulfonate/bicarbonate transport system substrate-binding protein [Corynebacterium aquatimens]
MNRESNPVKKMCALVMTLFMAAGLAACAGGDDAASGDGATKIRFALDWTPNTNHTGLYVAKNKGYFEEAGLDVEILPYNDSNPDLMVDSGQADFGISFQDAATISMAAGANIKSVLAVEQTWATVVSVLAERDDINTPKDLDGKKFGSFGLPSDEAVMRGVIQAAGGKGEFENITLNTAAYEALYSGDVDFTVPYVAWEGIEAEDRGVKLKNFTYTDYGFPDCYQVIVVGNNDWLKDHPEEAKKFVQALQRGYEDAVKDPDGSAEILQKENADLLTDLDFLKRSQRMLSKDFMLDDEGKFGRQKEERWAGLGTFLYDADLLVDDKNKQLTSPPNWADYFTNEYLAD